jgi:nucleoside 2-deoxyribosyltransferase
MKIYLAGPDVFYPNVKDIAKAKKDLCVQYGHEGLFPLDNKIDITKKGADLKIYLANLGLMKDADICIANMTPFRGPSMDVGTAFEIGYMTALGKKVYGYTNAAGLYQVRVFEHTSAKVVFANFDVDDKGYSVENFGNVDNLMIDRAIVAGTQKAIARPTYTAPDDDLTMFELVLKWSVRDLTTV